jgi:hypothetical protein
MIETSFFTCPDKGKMLAIYFDDRSEINTSFLSQFIHSDKIERYVELIFRKDGRQSVSTLIKHELSNENIVEEIVDCLVSNKSPELEIL